MTRPSSLPAFAFALAAISALSAGCATFHPLVSPGEGGAAWTELKTAHFVLKTDLDPADAQAVARKLEDTFAELADLGFPSEDKPKETIDVVYFRHRESYVQFAPQLTGALFNPGGFHDFERRSTALIGGSYDERVRENVQHELTHRFIHYYYPQAPVWLNEGFAQYLEVLEVEGGTAIVGRALLKSRFWRGDWGTRSGTILLPIDQAPTLAQLRAMPPTEFYKNRSADPRTSEGRVGALQIQIHYQAAWALVHFLLESPTYSAAFREYLDRLHAGEPDKTAWDGTVGSVAPDEKLEADYKVALAPLEVTTLRTKYTPPPVAEPQVRSMSDAEVHLLWARMRDWNNPKAHAAAEEDIAAAKRAGPSSELALVESVWRATNGDFAGARDELQHAADAAPEDTRLWNALGWLTWRSDLHPGVTKATLHADLAPVVAKLSPIATSASELDLLAHASLYGGQPTAAIAYEKRAVKVDPNCLDCLEWAATAMLEKGLAREALEVATFAEGLAPEGVRPMGLIDVADRARAAAAKSPAAPTAPASVESAQKP